MDCFLKCCVCCYTRNGSRCCAIFSLIATIFLLSFAVILKFQPEFIEIGEFDSEEEFLEQAEQALMNAYGGAITYSIVTVMCTMSFFYHSRKTGKLNKDAVNIKMREIPDILESKFSNGALSKY